MGDHVIYLDSGFNVGLIRFHKDLMGFEWDFTGISKRFNEELIRFHED